ncbi:MAG: aspartate aminotransferase family protein [Saprospiraceae bacterium]|nr:aspartate aminotransferase family protein [Saprospiraceae bacterium]
MYIRRQFLELIGNTSEIPQSFQVKSAKKCTIYNEHDLAYLDLISGFCVANIGHSHPKVIEAIEQQAGLYLHSNVYGEHVHSIQFRLAELICQLLPSRFNCLYYLSSGSEAIDASIKLARKATGRSEIITCRNAYHGSTLGAESLRSDTVERAAFRPLIPGIKFIEANDEQDLMYITDKTAAVITEVVQAEAGVVSLSHEYLSKLRTKCDQHKCLLIFDEIQTGFGRTGSLFAFQKSDVIPDILIIGKALGAGLPLSALVGNRELIYQFSQRPSLGYISTFGGNALCCAAALAGLKVLLEEDLIQRCNESAQLFVRQLVHSSIQEVRAEGLLIAVDFKSSKTVWSLILDLYQSKILAESFLFSHGSLRISPPLIISKDEISKASVVLLDLLDRSHSS